MTKPTDRTVLIPGQVGWHSKVLPMQELLDLVTGFDSESERSGLEGTVCVRIQDLWLAFRRIQLPALICASTDLRFATYTSWLGQRALLCTTRNSEENEDSADQNG